MRIAHVIDSLEIGGAEAVVAALSREHTAAGHRVEVHCLMARGPLATELERQHVPVFVHGSSNSHGSAWTLFKTFRRSRPDVVHCHNKTATVRAAASARLAGARAVVSTRHGMIPLPFRLRRELKFWITVALLCDRVVAVCDVARRNMMIGARSAADKLVTIRNGAFPPSGDPAQTREQRVRLRERYGGQGFTLVTVGRLVAAKNLDTLLRAVAIARSEVTDLALRIVGDGEERPALERLSADLGLTSIVQFCGEQHDVGNWLGAADVFALSSISEGMPISMLEAMAAGLPAIVTDVGALPELVAMSGAGVIVPVRRADRLARAIVDFARRRHDLAVLGKRASDCYRAYFTPDRMAAEYLELYRACVAGRAGVRT
jgi:glycosyltransferase involved in cell wall biosynthesis